MQFDRDTPQLVCGTPDPILPGMARDGDQPAEDHLDSVWDKRDITYAFSDTPPGSSNGPIEQKLTAERAQAAVRYAFNTWEKQSGVQLRFAKVEIDQDPDLIIEWVPAVHDKETRNTVGGRWVIADDLDLTDSKAPAAAHADFPAAPTKAEHRPLPIHFDDTEVLWTEDNVKVIALHEIGHALGLSHVDVTPDDPDDPPLNVMADAPPHFLDLQPNDIERIQNRYGVPGPQRFNAIWNKGTLARRAAWALTRDELHAEIDKQQPGGYRPERFNAYQLPEGTRYNAVFAKINDEWHYVTDRTPADFDAEHAKWQAEGFTLTDVSTVVLGNGQDRWSGIWVRDPEHRWKAQLGLSFDELDRAIAHNERDMLRPILVNAYLLPDGQGERWNVISVGNLDFGGARLWHIRWNMTRAEFDQLGVDHAGEDYELTYVSTFVLPDGQGERWNGIWEKRALRLHTHAIWGFVEQDARRRVTRFERQAVEPWVLNAYVLPPALTTTTTVVQQSPPPGLHGNVSGIDIDGDRLYATRYFQSTDPKQPTGNSGSLLVIDRATLAITTEVAVGNVPRSVAVNPVTNRIYVLGGSQPATPTISRITVIDRSSLGVIATIPFTTAQAARDLKVNPVTNRIYVSNPSQGRIHVFDGRTNAELNPILIGRGPLGMAIDQTTNILYVALSNLSVPPHVTGLGVVTDDGTHREIHPIVPIEPELAQPQGVAVDPVGDRVYVVNVGAAAQASPSVMVYDRRSLDLIATVPLRGPGRALAVNSDARQVYVAGDAAVHVLDAVTLSVARTIPVGRAPWAIAAAGGTARQVYLGDQHNGQLTRLA